ncbi:hypothetical protein NV379_00995 [Paenibacillus sp. N1-5-1-14]|uniref:hypothetical protein n=1 Tax=Paenibacillus radicibacter TaxID=2972488 RepID=UPI0021593C21|nr:hypothetical protein [Paenibacillus radicibacter]MCR8641219.1 hypothetical protein [Paenibacillus radicibacter]
MPQLRESCLFDPDGNIVILLSSSEVEPSRTALAQKLIHNLNTFMKQAFLTLTTKMFDVQTTDKDSLIDDVQIYVHNHVLSKRIPH